MVQYFPGTLSTQGYVVSRPDAIAVHHCNSGRPPGLRAVHQRVDMVVATRFRMLGQYSCRPGSLVMKRLADT
jgi:hypothetical protein